MLLFHLLVWWCNLYDCWMSVLSLYQHQDTLDGICGGDYLSFFDHMYYYTLIWVEGHHPVIFPLLKVVEILLQCHGICCGWYYPVNQTIIHIKMCCWCDTFWQIINVDQCDLWDFRCDGKVLGWMTTDKYLFYSACLFYFAMFEPWTFLCAHVLFTMI